MKQKLLFLFLVISLLFNAYFVKKTTSDTTVKEILDGDTFILNNGDRIRLLGIDAPEKDLCGAKEATQTLSVLIAAKPVTIKEERRDGFGRRMGLVYVGSTLVNEAMLASGWARPDYDKNTQSERLKAAYRKASEDKLGIHSSQRKKVNPQPPSADCTIKGNIDKGTWDHLYHLPTCRHYNQIILDMDMGEQFFCSESEAQAAGFTLAPDCLR